MAPDSERRGLAYWRLFVFAGMPAATLCPLLISLLLIIFAIQDSWQDHPLPLVGCIVGQTAGGDSREVGFGWAGAVACSTGAPLSCCVLCVSEVELSWAHAACHSLC